MTDVCDLQIEMSRLRAENERLQALLDTENSAVLARVEQVASGWDALRTELAAQKAVNLQLAERLAACSAVLGRLAGRGKVCECQLAEENKLPLPTV